MRKQTKRGKTNEFELIAPYEINLDKFELGPESNKVLIEVFPDDVKKTVGGLITEGISHHNFAGFATRRGRVVKVCDRIVITKNGIDTQIWECDVEVLPGDIVYTNHMDAWNSYMFTDDGKRIMRLVPYNSIQLAIRKVYSYDNNNRRYNEEIIMCNGYVLYEQIKNKVKYNIAGKEIEVIGDKYIKNEGIAKFVGSLNRRYRIPGDKKDMDRTDYGTESLMPGDRFMIEDPRKTWELENYCFAIFDNRKMYKIVQRYNISAILNYVL